MKELYTQLRTKLKGVSKRKLIAISLSVKAVQVAVSTYLIKKFFLN